MNIIFISYICIYIYIINKLLRESVNIKKKIDKYGIFIKTSLYYTEDRKNYYLLILLIICTIIIYSYLIIMIPLVNKMELSISYLISLKYVLRYIYIISLINTIIIPILNENQKNYKISFIKLYWYLNLLNIIVLYINGYSVYIYIIYISILILIFLRKKYKTGYYKKGQSNFLDIEEIQKKSSLSLKNKNY